MPYRITQCYLPPGSGDFPAFDTPPKLVLDLVTLGECKAELLPANRHPAVMTFPPLPKPKLVLDLATPIYRVN